jgi:hypothetical protein
MSILLGAPGESTATPFLTGSDVLARGVPDVTRPMDTPAMSLSAIAILEVTPVIERRRGVLERWIRSWTAKPETEELENSTTTPDILRGEHFMPLALNPPSAWEAARQLRNWLGVTYAELSAITGVGTSTFHSWRGSGVVPRPSKVQGLWLLYSFARALQSRIGTLEASVWLRSGDPSPLAMLLDGRHEDVERLAYSSVLRPLTIESNRFMTARVEDALGEEPVMVQSPRSEPVRRSTRAVKKGRPARRD